MASLIGRFSILAAGERDEINEHKTKITAITVMAHNDHKFNKP
jgi:hypothetical protein